jgi:diguanylate cyclase (GGDEF)-like protein
MKIGSLFASLFVYVLLFAGATVAVLAAVFSASPAYDWPAFATLALLAFLAQLFDFLTSVDDHHEQSTTAIFFFAGVLLLHPLLFVLLVLIPQLLVWFKGRLLGGGSAKLWYPQPLGVAIHVIAGLSSGAIFGLINPDPTQLVSPIAILGVSAAALNYAILQQALSGVALILARKATVQESRVLDIERLLTGFVMLCLGFVVAVLWRTSPWLILPVLPQLVLIYRALNIPRLRAQAQIDVKTGLWTARHFNTLFAAEVNRAVRFGRPLALIMSDLDYLRVINNTYGHLAGDAVLASVGQTMREALREYDIAGRFGGEEFAIVLPETAEAEASVIAERIRQAVATTPIKVPTSRTPVHVTMSLGIACFPESGPTALELMHRADVAVYQAKLRGRNRVVTGSDVAAELLRAGGLVRLGMPLANARDLIPSRLGVERPADLSASSRLMLRLQSLFPPLDHLARRLSLASILAALLLSCVLLLGAVGVLGAAARNALPGETLYPLETTYEGAQLAFALTPAERARLHLTFARNRLEETITLVARGRYAFVGQTLSAYEQEIQRANDTLETIPSQDYANRVLVASYLQQSLLENAAILSSLPVKSPPELKGQVAHAMGVTDENISAARVAITEAALPLRGTPANTKVAVAVPTSKPELTPTAPATSQAAQTSIPAPTSNASRSATPVQGTEAPIPTDTFVPAPSTPEPTHVPNPTETSAPPTEVPAPTRATQTPTEMPPATIVPSPAEPPTQTLGPTASPPSTASSGGQFSNAEPTETRASARPAVLWSADMETGDLSQWAQPSSLLASYHGGGVYDIRSGSVSVTDKVAHSGRYSLEMTIDDGAGASQAVRLFRWGENPVMAIYSIWYLFPQTYNPAHWWNVMQFKSKATNPYDTLWVLNVGNRPSGEMYFYLFDWQQRIGHDQTVRDIPIGRWVHVEVLYRRSTTNNGRIAVWQDGVPLFDLRNVQTATSDEIQWSVDNYTDQISPAPATIYADDAMISTGRIGP